ncbi:MAG: hypothetical protein NVSMB1_23330 [Polyangiales bacterium]
MVSTREPGSDVVREPLRISVVIATYNRQALLTRLLQQLAEQTMPPDRFEVIVVDDGSQAPVSPHLESVHFPYHLTLLAQANAGAAAARHAGIMHAQGDLIVIVDDDMQVPPEFLSEHDAAHPDHSRRVVLGQFRDHGAIDTLPLFERYHASSVASWVKALSGGLALVGNNLWTGNVSLRRRDYLDVGGFDPTLERSEDAEIGLRLEQAAVSFHFSQRAYTIHGSDHVDLERWLGRCFRYGVFDARIAKKHPTILHADPWRYLFLLPKVSRPFVSISVLWPSLSRRLAPLAMMGASGLDTIGLKALAVKATGLVYGMEYFRGLRREAGTLRAALRGCRDFLAKAASSESTPAGVPRRLSLAAKALAAMQADYACRVRYQEKYGSKDAVPRSIASDMVASIGLQMLCGYRVMRFFREAEMPLAAMVVSRLMRHAYGADIHWDAQFAPGVMIVHGMGLAISHAACVEEGAILSQNVTLGMGIDPVTRRTGAPQVGKNVHVGAGATLIGPIVIGAGSKIMPHAVVTTSVPEKSLVKAPVAEVVKR